MNLHTHSLVDPRVLVIAQVNFLGWVIRLSVIYSKDSRSSKVRRPRYVSIALSDRREWVDEFEELHDLVADRKAGLPMGEVFQRGNSDNVRQNRLLLQKLPHFLVPAWLRAFISGKKIPFWALEVYGFYAVNSKGKMGRYTKLQVEVAPWPRKFQPRDELGCESVWRRAGRYAQFEACLRSTDIPAAIRHGDKAVAKKARLAGRAISLPAFYMCSVLARIAWRYALRHPAIRWQRAA